jgi:hypothetical protein
MKRVRPEVSAAIVNGLVVMLLPLAFMTLALMLPGPRGADAIVVAHVRTTRDVLLDVWKVVAQTAVVMLPFAMLASWRTFVYAKQVLTSQGRGWRGVGEAAVCGFGTLLLYLLPGIVTRPMEAPPYILFYGAVAAVLGVLVGLTLRMTALFVLWLQPKVAH